jgi:protein SCO1/2
MDHFNCEMRKAAWGRIATMFCLTIALAGCDRSKPADSSARFYQVRGIVRAFAPDRNTVSVEHENIPGIMPSMTMPFSVRDQKDIAGLKIGDAISFRMTITDKDLFIDQVKEIPASEVHLAESAPTGRASPAVSARLREGDIIPSFTLANQDGGRVTLETFRGRPFILTFIFTRCPVPKFCPLISHNFSELQEAIKADAGAAGKTRLLSITLDPKFDTPEILKRYAQEQNADLQIWTFATGERAEVEKLIQSFAVFVQPEAGTISHGLATALISPDGHVVNIWRGNAWKSSEVIDELRRQIK